MMSTTTSLCFAHTDKVQYVPGKPARRRGGKADRIKFANRTNDYPFNCHFSPRFVYLIKLY